MNLVVLFYFVASFLLINHQTNSAPTSEAEFKFDEFEKFIRHKNIKSLLDDYKDIANSLQTTFKTDIGDQNNVLHKAMRNLLEDDDDDKKNNDNPDDVIDPDCLEEAKERLGAYEKKSFSDFMNCKTLGDIIDGINGIINNTFDVTNATLLAAENITMSGISCFPTKGFNLSTCIFDFLADTSSSIKMDKDSFVNYITYLEQNVPTLKKDLHKCWYIDHTETNNDLKEKVEELAKECTEKKKKDKENKKNPTEPDDNKKKQN